MRRIDGGNHIYSTVYQMQFMCRYVKFTGETTNDWDNGGSKPATMTCVNENATAL